MTQTATRILSIQTGYCGLHHRRHSRLVWWFLNRSWRSRCWEITARAR